MTKTALRALTVAALSVAVLASTAGTALADDTASDPCFRQDIECYGTPDAPITEPQFPDFGEQYDVVCPDATEFDGTRCVAVQLPEESTGGYRCPDPADTVPCDTASVPQGDADAGAAPADRDGERPAGTVSTTGTGTAPTAATVQSGVPLWVLQDKSNEAVRDIAARCAYAFSVLG